MSIRNRTRQHWHDSERVADSLHPLRRFLPTVRIRNAVLGTRRGLRWGIPAMLLALPYIEAIKYLTAYIEQAGPGTGWPQLIILLCVLIVLLCVYNTIKMLLLGPLSLLYLARARYLERKARKQAEADAAEAEVEREFVEAHA